MRRWKIENLEQETKDWACQELKSQVGILNVVAKAAPSGRLHGAWTWRWKSWPCSCLGERSRQREEPVQKWSTGNVPDVSEEQQGGLWGWRGSKEESNKRWSRRRDMNQLMQSLAGGRGLLSKMGSCWVLSRGVTDMHYVLKWSLGFCVENRLW